MDGIPEVLKSGLSAPGERIAESESYMSSNIESDDEMREDYDFSNGVRGKYVDFLRDRGQLIMLEPDVAEVFSDSEAVNSTLRGLIPAIKNQAEKVNHR